MIINNMTDIELRYQKMLSKIRERGSRVTSHRIALLRLIAASEGHPTAAQLYERLRVQFPSVSLATVYKTIALLKEDHEVLEIDLHGESRYDGNRPYPHPHLICTRCGRIIDGDDLPSLRNLNQQISEKYGFQVLHQHQVFYGICPQCQSETASQPGSAVG